MQNVLVLLQQDYSNLTITVKKIKAFVVVNKKKLINVI